MTAMVAPAAPPLTVGALEDLLLELLGDLLDEAPDELRGRLLAAGAQMPIDSLDLFDILAEFRKRTSLTLPARKMRRDTMRSVKALAKFSAEQGQ